ncbi:PRC-barrel domain containing protein [Kitasatospora sp. NPDC048540]|uniref:hypothetical protein n=1 Tax=unclassified Kitasatospora TaxID=2633591 RepID=UPI00053968D5|nr:hypothetical protein [Kitasatospora sp. MBT63]
MTDVRGHAPASQDAPGTGLVGFKVEASDGHIGKVDEATDDVGSAHFVVNCRPWLLGRHVMLPAGTVTRVDHTNRTIHLNRTKEQVKGTPIYDPALHRGDADYRLGPTSYFGSP